MMAVQSGGLNWQPPPGSKSYSDADERSSLPSFGFHAALRVLLCRCIPTIEANMVAGGKMQNQNLPPLSPHFLV
jgi:hypothetical protein